TIGASTRSVSGASISWSRRSWIWYPSRRRSDSRTSARSVTVAIPMYAATSNEAEMRTAMTRGVMEAQTSIAMILRNQTNPNAAITDDTMMAMMPMLLWKSVDM